MIAHSIIIKRVSTSAVYSVRHPVLRKGKPLSSCVFVGDDLSTTTHFGLFSANNLVGVVSLFLQSTDLFSEKQQIQMRGMAILETSQRQGFGKLLLEEAENFAIGAQSELLWFNARLVAVPFYQAAGYEIAGDAFDISDIGLHYVMYKKLK